MNFIRSKWEQFWKQQWIVRFNKSNRSCNSCLYCYQSGKNVIWTGYDYKNWESGLVCEYYNNLCSEERLTTGKCGVHGENHLWIAIRQQKSMFSKFGAWNRNAKVLVDYESDQSIPRKTLMENNS